MLLTFFACHECRLATSFVADCWHYRQEILDAIKDNQVILLAGETGCGKTTQVPQYILEDAWGAPLVVYHLSPTLPYGVQEAGVSLYNIRCPIAVVAAVVLVCIGCARTAVGVQSEDDNRPVKERL